MANWCVNRVTFTGEPEKVEAAYNFFREIEHKQDNKLKWEMPEYLRNNSTIPFDVGVGDKGVYFRTPWSPGLSTIAQIAQNFGVDYVHKYEEPGMLILGESRMKNKVFSNVALEYGELTGITYDAGTEDFVFEGRHYTEDWEIFLELLERKKKALEPARTRNENFPSTGNITPEQIREQYGEVTPVELVLRLAQHKNFNAAQQEFDKWQDAFVSEAGEFLNHDYLYHEYNYNTGSKYMALMFLRSLIEERETLIEKMAEQVKQRALQQELIAWRLAGKLPHIDIHGTDFTIDLRLGELRETDVPWNRIEISELETDNDSDNRLFFYDTREHKLWELEDDLTELPENVVMVELPDDLILDPVAAARQVGYADDKFLQEYPIQQNLKAGIRQLSETFLPEFVADNYSKKYMRGYGR